MVGFRRDGQIGNQENQETIYSIVQVFGCYIIVYCKFVNSQLIHQTLFMASHVCTQPYND